MIKDVKFLKLRKRVEDEKTPESIQSIRFKINLFSEKYLF